MVKIKICGLKRLEDIEIANKYKPDYIGFVFADSKRNFAFEPVPLANMAIFISSKSFLK